MTRTMKPKINRAGRKHKASAYDDCATPSYAINPLLPYLPKSTIIWEPFAGSGNMVRTLRYHGYPVISTDIHTGYDFFEYVPNEPWDVLVSNPPYSVKYDVLRRCYELGKPFALLMPVEMIATATGSEMFDKYGIEIIYPTPRINFFMPNLGYTGNGAQFPTAWYCWKLNIGQAGMWVDLPHEFLPFEQEMLDFQPPAGAKKMSDKVRIKKYEEALTQIAQWGRGNPNEPWVRAHHQPLIDLAEQTLKQCV